MFHSARIAVCCLSFALLAGCAGTTRPSADAPAENPDRRWRALLLQAEDSRQTNAAVLDGLTSEDPGRRRLAVRALGRIGDPALLAAVDDADTSVRAEAVFAAGIAGLHESLAAIIERRKDPDADVRTAVALTLGLFATADTLAPLAELLSDSQTDVRIAACYSVARLSAADPIVPALLEMLSDTDERVAVAATYALSRLSGRREGLSLEKRFEARSALILAKDQSARIRALVAEGLYNPVAGEQADTLAALLKSSKERAVLLAIIRSTSFPGAPTFVIHELTIRHADEQVVLATLYGLARMRGPDTNAVLVDFIVNDDRDWLQAEAIRALGQADAHTALQVANGLSIDPNPVILAATAETLYGRPEDEAAEYAQRLFKSTHPWVRYHTIPAMGCVKQHLTDLFADLLASSTIEEKIQLARAAGYRLSMPDRPDADYDDAFRLLSDLWGAATDSTALALQLAVLDAAAQGRRSAGSAMIRRALTAEDSGIRHRAAALLREHYDESVDVEPTRPRPIEYYERIVDWAERERAAIVTVYRPGFDPGAFSLTLDTERSPMTAFRFAELAEQGYYNQRRIDTFVPGLRVHTGRGGENNYAADSWRAEAVVSTFPAGTLAAVADGPETLLGEWMITLDSRPNYLGRYWPFGRVTRSLGGVVGNILPIDRVISVRVYEGNGLEAQMPSR